MKIKAENQSGRFTLERSKQVWLCLLSLFVMILVGGCRTSMDYWQKEQHTLRVVSYNIKHGRGMDGVVDLNRIADVIRKLDPDLLALQEVDKFCERSGSRDIAKELGEMLNMEHSFGKFMDYQGGEYGMAVLSRFPIKESYRHPLPDGAEPRCALEVEVQVDGMRSPLSFVGIHNDWTNEAIRVKQIDALLTAIQDRQHPIILAGDFNGERSDQSMQPLQMAPWTILGKGDEKTFPSDDPRVEIDFIVLRGFPESSIEHDVIDEKVASDHRPILASITFTEPVSENIPL